MNAAGSVLFGLGANIGDPAAQLSFAVRRLTEALGPVTTSSVYRTQPVGYSAQPEFLNLVCRASERAAPEALLELALQIEADLGRERSVRNGPRRIDVDLLAVGDRVVERPGLVIPHPRLHTRAFVLIPLAEVAPEWRHPLLGKTAAEMLAARDDWERVESLGTLCLL